MARPFTLPSEDEAEEQGQQLEQLMLDLYAALQQVLRSRRAEHPSRNHRLPRRAGDVPGSREHPVVLVDSDLSRLPLPDLVLSAVEQLPPPTPLVTVSAPSSPTRDAAFQFPECSAAPVPSPRARPRRRRLTSEGSVLEKERVNASCGQIGTVVNEREWTSVGTNLRNIADDFHAAKTKDAEVEKSRLPFIGSGFSSSPSTDSLLSLLIPAPLRETLWTTVALYLGWRLVSRLR
ncbi:uncharacterized protein LOC107274563 [Cephus cinctus]|uniref:Uncharacterized protein LOC107274563 n=1 Tax=Cephus cinctus TaxID=211228 RepID=A0AAJ7FUS9_CEPCN|nr:uncharacterized protein LOC107274563 [Cephus cinctus]XP_024947782.1 uncharacterized protein LOC107274563 [Cephus cinctus]XP_024947783.1 uncharacterized protein LOC107274563 [Cephus cinctus]XP_024947784.1 uncharacterized protein LOC107274563 [Cephus cinctus]